ncbi:MAG TPA: FBP domain-containing protein [Candidatus Chromulinivoraceae bacterium]|nr:FBP domain-containing protein [Candidatus Chromulinivoraceae bacterium]
MNVITREQFTQLVRPLKPRLKRELRFIPEEITEWEDRDFLGVANKQGNEGVLIIPFLDIVVPYGLSKRTPGSRGRVEAIICDICATWQRGTHSAVITFQTSPIRSVSFLCCEDLRCSLHVRGKTSAAVLSRAQIREQIDPQERINRLRKRLTNIIETLA